MTKAQNVSTKETLRTGWKPIALDTLVSALVEHFLRFGHCQSRRHAPLLRQIKMEQREAGLLAAPERSFVSRKKGTYRRYSQVKEDLSYSTSLLRSTEATRAT